MISITTPVNASKLSNSVKMIEEWKSTSIQFFVKNDVTVSQAPDKELMTDGFE
jgi:hypothetical protein